MKLTDEILSQHAAEARDIWLATLPQREEVPEHRFSHRFTRAMNRLIREQRRTPWMRRVVRYARNAAVFVLVVLTVTFSGLMTVEAYRIAVIDTITRIFHEFTEFRYTSEVSAEDAEFPEVSFDYLPDGMVESESGMDETDTIRHIHYEHPNGALFDLDEILITSNDAFTQIIDTEDASVEKFSIKGEPALSSVKGETVIITWTHQNVSYTMITYKISPENARQIVLGIRYT